MKYYSPSESHLIDVVERTAVGEARRVASEMAAKLGFTPTQASNLAIVATEAGTNLAQHAKAGRLLIQAIRQGAMDYVEVIAIDRGPGMADVTRCIRDGYSTAGTAGQGLGAMMRLSSFADIYSMAGVGTAVVARVAARTPIEAAVPDESLIEVGAISIPKPGEHHSGDAWCVSAQPERVMAMVVDGLGHGPQASEAAIEARRIFLENVGREPVAILELAHAALRKTRGAAMAVSDIDLAQRQMHFAGVGNIAGTVWSEGASRSMVSYNGIVGHEVRKFSHFAYPFPAGAILIMASDGLSTHCSFEAFPGLATRHPSLIAAMLFRDFARGRDDATIVAIRAE